MFSLTKLRQIRNHKPVDSGSSSNPFDSDDDDNKHTLKPSNRISPEPLATKNLSFNPFDDDVENLEGYAVYKSRETTKTVRGCLKVAEDIRTNATRTLVILNEQGDQITKTHQKAVNIDLDLSRGEKLLGSLGGIFSKTWKPKKTRSLTGPVITKDESPKRRGNYLETREKLGLNHVPKCPKPKTRTTREPLPESADAYQIIEMEKAKQDDGLDDLSDLLGELKNMAVDMGTEIERQNNGLDHLQDDVDELNYRVKQSNQRARRLLGK